MTSILLAVYGIFLILTGINGNGPKMFALLQTEHQFLYWVLVMLILGALWEVDAGEELAKSFAVLIVIGFLLHNSNYKTFGANLSAILKPTTGAQ